MRSRGFVSTFMSIGSVIDGVCETNTRTRDRRFRRKLPSQYWITFNDLLVPLRTAPLPTCLAVLAADAKL